jgi:hypothetical protein
MGNKFNLSPPTVVNAVGFVVGVILGLGGAVARVFCAVAVAGAGAGVVILVVIVVVVVCVVNVSSFSLLMLSLSLRVVLWLSVN